MHAASFKIKCFLGVVNVILAMMVRSICNSTIIYPQIVCKLLMIFFIVLFSFAVKKCSFSQYSGRYQSVFLNTVL